MPLSAILQDSGMLIRWALCTAPVTCLLSDAAAWYVRACIFLNCSLALACRLLNSQHSHVAAGPLAMAIPLSEGASARLDEAQREALAEMCGDDGLLFTSGWDLDDDVSVSGSVMYLTGAVPGVSMLSREPSLRIRTSVKPVGSGYQQSSDPSSNAAVQSSGRQSIVPAVRTRPSLSSRGIPHMANLANTNSLARVATHR